MLHKARLSTTGLIPVLGPRTYQQPASDLSALEVTLSLEQIARLDEKSEIALGTPHEQIHGSAAAIAGGKPELLQTRIPVVKIETRRNDRRQYGKDACRASRWPEPAH